MPLILPTRKQQLGEALERGIQLQRLRARRELCTAGRATALCIWPPHVEQLGEAATAGGMAARQGGWPSRQVQAQAARQFFSHSHQQILGQSTMVQYRRWVCQWNAAGAG